MCRIQRLVRNYSINRWSRKMYRTEIDRMLPVGCSKYRPNPTPKCLQLLFWEIRSVLALFTKRTACSTKITRNIWWDLSSLCSAFSISYVVNSGFINFVQRMWWKSSQWYPKPNIRSIVMIARTHFPQESPWRNTNAVPFHTILNVNFAKRGMQLKQLSRILQQNLFASHFRNQASVDVLNSYFKWTNCQ